MPHQTQAQKEQKNVLIQQFKLTTQDTGSPEVQVALVTNRINKLTEHLKIYQKDFSSQRGLLKLVGRRRCLLDYLKACDLSRYSKLINSLDLRK